MPECQNCGTWVTNQFARVFGDNDDQVRQCQKCEKKRIGGTLV